MDITTQKGKIWAMIIPLLIGGAATDERNSHSWFCNQIKLSFLILAPTLAVECTFLSCTRPKNVFILHHYHIQLPSDDVLQVFLEGSPHPTLSPCA